MPAVVSELEERTIELYTNWMTIWSIVYVVVLAVLYAYLYDWLKHLEVTGCACAKGLDFQYMKYFPLATLILNMFVIILANSISASKSVTARVFVSVFTILSVPSMIGWCIYVAAFIGFVRRVDRENCLCAVKGEGSTVALWTLVSQICHAFISIAFAVVMIVLIGSKYTEVVNETWGHVVAWVRRAAVFSK